VFTIDADATTPAQVGSDASVGTILFNMAVNPRNEVRFEGPGDFGGSTVQGRLHEARVTVLSGSSTVTARHLNKHINYNLRPAPAGTKDASLLIPTAIAVQDRGASLAPLVYVAAFGSSKAGVFDASQLENNTFTPRPSNHIEVSGGGPGGLVVDAARNRLYVLTRFMTGSRRSDGLPFDINQSPAGFNCVGCHTLDPASGFFGTNGDASFEGEPGS
jgi:hypothetical protein